MFPIAVGVGLIVLAIILALVIPRGSTGEEEGARTSTRARRPTGAPWDLLVGLFVAVIVSVVVPLGWAITGTLLFAGAATILAQQYVLNVIIGVVLAVASFYAFYSGSGSRCPPAFWTGFSDMDNLNWLLQGFAERPPR